MADKAFFMCFIHDGKLDCIYDFDVQKCLAMYCIQKKFGLKMTTGFGNGIGYHEDNRMFQSALISTETIRDKVFTDREVRICDDGIHYERQLSGFKGTMVQKIAFGNIRLPQEA